MEKKSWKRWKNLAWPQIAAEHNLPQAQHDLKNGWKAWIKENCPNKGGRASTENRPVNGLKSIDRK
jgi:hypothetical protein